MLVLARLDVLYCCWKGICCVCLVGFWPVLQALCRKLRSFANHAAASFEHSARPSAKSLRATALRMLLPSSTIHVVSTCLAAVPLVVPLVVVPAAVQELAVHA